MTYILLPKVTNRNTFLDRILAVDQQLHQLADHYIDHEFVHPKVVIKEKVAVGPKMNSAPEMARTTKLAIDVVSPCGGNLGRNHTLVTMVFNRVSDTRRRKALRDTFGGAMNRNPKTSLYFIVGRESDTK